MSSVKELADYARFLRNAAPREFEDFYTAFGNYSRSMVDHLINATGDVDLAQGRAQQCMKILRVLEDVRNG